MVFWAWRIDPLQGGGGSRAHCGRRQRFGFLDIRGVIGAVGERDGVLARIGQHLKFVAGIAADRAGIRLHRAEVQARAG